MRSEEPFNYLEQKIKDAAENYEIVFEESSWIKMETLLDKEPKRKRFVWWWFVLLILITGGLGVFVANKQQQKEKITTSRAQKNIVIKEPTLASFTPVEDSKPLDKNEKVTSDHNNVLNSSLNKRDNVFKAGQKIKSSILSKIINIKAFEINEENISQNKTSFTQKANTNFTVSNSDATESDTVLDNVTNKKNDSTNDFTKKKTVEKTILDSTSIVSKKEKETIKKPSSLSKFYLIGSLGADVSSTKLLAYKNNPASLKYGLALGFNINKKLSAQAGFYAGKKKYIAKEGEYYFKTGSYFNTIKILKVNADCIVYEIPVSVRYNVIQKKTLNLYTGVGISSYIMKEEDYIVHYIRNNIPASRAWHNSGNRHLLSTLSILAGAEKKLTDKIFLQIEPSVSIPLKGVGEGNVKIFSTALQVGLKYLPFK